jgi:hypothetical protein
LGFRRDYLLFLQAVDALSKDDRYLLERAVFEWNQCAADLVERDFFYAV